MPGVTSIPIQNFNWFLVEDARSISATDEYFDGGTYDEAALWYRALSAEEMSALYTQGINAEDVNKVTVPEPSGLTLWSVGVGAIAFYNWKKRRTVRGIRL